MIHSFTIIKRPLITEKSNIQKDTQRKYFFEVDRRANRHQVKKAIEYVFKVKVADVNIQIVRGKYKRVGRFIGKRSNWKKAIVTLEKDNQIDFFGGI